MSAAKDTKSAAGNLFLLFSFLIRDGNLLRSPVLAYAILASFTRSGMIFAINAIAGGAAIAFGNVALLAVTVISTLTFSHLARVNSFKLVETTKRRMRTRLSRRLLDARADYLATRDQGKVYSIVTHEVNQISSASTNFIESLEACLLIAFCIPYLFYLSWPSGAATLATLGAPRDGGVS